MTGFLSEHTIKWVEEKSNMECAIEYFENAKKVKKEWAKNWLVNSWLALFWAAEAGEI